tara:strand:+ start:42 stop:218 length:177 start_codon:yes stop_codon:yes gene_type:complete
MISASLVGIIVQEAKKQPQRSEARRQKQADKERKQRAIEDVATDMLASNKLVLSSSQV